MIYDLSSEYSAKKAQGYLDKLLKSGATCEVKEVRKKRSKRSNGYYWAIISLFALETGYTKKEAHKVMKRKHGLIYEKNGEKFLTSTADLDSKEMADYIDGVRNRAALVDIYLPTADEYNQGGWIEIENLIEQNKAHL